MKYLKFLKQRSIMSFMIFLLAFFLFYSYTSSTVKAEAYDLTCRVGESIELKAFIEKIDSGLLTKGNIKWSSSDSIIATVSNGKVTGKAEGYVSITASTADSTNAKSATVTVYVQSTVDRVRFVNKVVDIKVGEQVELPYNLIPKSGFDSVYLKTISMKLSDTSIASISSSKVRGIKEGTVEITVTSTDGSKTDTCTVNVHSTVTGVKLNLFGLNIDVGEKLILLPTVEPEDAYLKTVKFSSTNNRVASVSSNGEVIGIKEGSTTIIAKTDDGGYEAKCIVNVISKVTGIKLDKTELSLNENGEAYNKLNVVFVSKSGVNPINNKITWKSSDSSVATVSNGIVTPKNRGTTTITATSVDGNYSATCAVTVGYVKVESINFSQGTHYEMYCGETFTIGYYITPSNATKKDVKLEGYYSFDGADNSYIAAKEVLSKKSGDWVLQPRHQGTYKIKITAVDGGFSDTMYVKVKSMIKGISIITNGLEKDENGNYYIYQGQEIDNISYKLIPIEGMSEDKIILTGAKWTSKDSSAVTVNSSGLLKGKLYEKKSVIEVTSDDNSFTDSISIYVKSMADSVNFMGSKAKFTAGVEYTVGEKENSLRFAITPKNNLGYNLNEVIDRSVKLQVSDEMVEKSIFFDSVEDMEKEKRSEEDKLLDLKRSLSSASDDEMKEINRNISSVNSRITKLQKKIDEFNLLIAESTESDYVSVSLRGGGHVRDIDNKEIVVVSLSGDSKIIGKNAGKAKLTLTTNDGKLTSSCDLEVQPAAKTTSGNIVILDSNNNVISTSSSNSDDKSKTNSVMANSYDEEYSTVGFTEDKNKVWRINFSHPINLMEPSCIYVTNEAFENVEVKIEEDKNIPSGKTIKITPLKPYSSGIYYIFITKKVVSATSDEALPSSIRMTFIVK